MGSVGEREPPPTIRANLRACSLTLRAESRWPDFRARAYPVMVQERPGQDVAPYQREISPWTG